MPTIGQQLQQARLALDLSVEDAAFRTRIPAGLVRNMEQDDLSHFGNLTYARAFLKLYSQFLGVDIAEHLSQFSTEEFSHAAGHEYVQTANATMNLPAAVFTNYGRSWRPGLYVLLIVALASGGVIWWHNHRKEEVVTKAEPATAPPPVAVVPPEPKKPVPPPEPVPVVPAPPVVEPAASPEPPVTPPPAVPEPAVTKPSVPDAPPAKPPKAVVVEEEETPPPKKK